MPLRILITGFFQYALQHRQVAYPIAGKFDKPAETLLKIITLYS